MPPWLKGMLIGALIGAGILLLVAIAILSHGAVLPFIMGVVTTTTATAFTTYFSLTAIFAGILIVPTLIGGLIGKISECFSDPEIPETLIGTIHYDQLSPTLADAVDKISHGNIVDYTSRKSPLIQNSLNSTNVVHVDIVDNSDDSVHDNDQNNVI
jgi:hypothetical protein